MERNITRHEGYNLNDGYKKEFLEYSGVEIAHILPQEFPITDRLCCVTFVFCTDEYHQDGIIIYAGSRRMENLSHEGLFQLASDMEAIDENTAEGHWGGHLSLNNPDDLNLIRKSHGFPGEPDREIYGDFIEKIYEKLQ
jgi:hypothetical protein